MSSVGCAPHFGRWVQSFGALLRQAQVLMATCHDLDIDLLDGKVMCATKHRYKERREWVESGEGSEWESAVQTSRGRYLRCPNPPI